MKWTHKNLYAMIFNNEYYSFTKKLIWKIFRIEKDPLGIFGWPQIWKCNKNRKHKFWNFSPFFSKYFHSQTWYMCLLCSFHDHKSKVETTVTRTWKFFWWIVLWRKWHLPYNLKYNALIEIQFSSMKYYTWWNLFEF